MHGGLSLGFGHLFVIRIQGLVIQLALCFRAVEFLLLCHATSFDFQNSPVSGHDAAWTMRTDF
jgi:hypothetical protein